LDPAGEALRTIAMNNYANKGTAICSMPSWRVNFIKRDRSLVLYISSTPKRRTQPGAWWTKPGRYFDTKPERLRLDATRIQAYILD
jgi:hypothetical protein